MSRHDVHSDIRALRRAAHLACPLLECSVHVYYLCCVWRAEEDLGCDLSAEEQAAFMILIAEVLENPQ